LGGLVGTVRLGRFPMLDFCLQYLDYPNPFRIWGVLVRHAQIGECLFQRTAIFRHHNNSGSRGAIFHRKPGPWPIFSANPRRVRSYRTFVKRLIMFPLDRTVGRGNLLRLDRRVGDLERFVDPLRDLPASEPCCGRGWRSNAGMPCGSVAGSNSRSVASRWINSPRAGRSPGCAFQSRRLSVTASCAAH